jgi:hypothetical protein
MTTATTGTADAVLGTAVARYISFAADGVRDGDVISYGINDGSNKEIEMGLVTVSGGVYTLVRKRIYSSTNNGAKLSLSGTAQVYVTQSAEDMETGTINAVAFGVYNDGVTDNGAYETIGGQLTGTPWNRLMIMMKSFGFGQSIVCTISISGTAAVITTYIKDPNDGNPTHYMQYKHGMCYGRSVTFETTGSLPQGLMLVKYII